MSVGPLSGTSPAVKADRVELEVDVETKWHEAGTEMSANGHGSGEGRLCELSFFCFMTDGPATDNMKSG